MSNQFDCRLSHSIHSKNFSQEKRDSIIKELEHIGNCKKDKHLYPTTEDQYELVEVIGEGTEGKVYKAVCLPLKKIVAIKIMDLYKSDSVLIKDIIKEARLMSENENHPNLIHYNTSFLDKENYLWLVMDYLAGGSLADILKYKYPNGIPEIFCIPILKGVLKGLQFLHDHARIHRDIKSDNILIGEDGEIELSDFGVGAQLEKQAMTARRTIVGTPCWMAPEVINERGYNEKIDIWSVGITAIELVRGKPPGSDLSPNKIFMNLLFGNPPSLEEDKEKGIVTALYKDFVDKCLYRDPEKRPSASKLLDHKLFKHAKKGQEVSDELLCDYCLYKEKASNGSDTSSNGSTSSPLTEPKSKESSWADGKPGIKRSPSDSRLNKSEDLPLSAKNKGDFIPRAASHPVNLSELENDHHHNPMSKSTGVSQHSSPSTTPGEISPKELHSPEKERKKSHHHTNSSTSSPSSSDEHHHHHHSGGFFKHIRRHSIARLFSSPLGSHKNKHATNGSTSPPLDTSSESVPNTKEPKDKDSKDKEPKDKELKDKESKDKESKDKEPKDKESKDKEKESKDKEHKEKDHKDKDKEHHHHHFPFPWRHHHHQTENVESN